MKMEIAFRESKKGEMFLNRMPKKKHNIYSSVRSVQFSKEDYREG